ncbi:MAG: PLDc N-terminal domain-containing protein, partial [Gorillibacterium sp.]|nr:PLDc N-terminal domain-containing protein [Gorillibacterium sp.]
MNYFNTTFSIISLLNLILAGVVIFWERRNIGTTWAWVMVLLFLPGVGFFLYLILGQNLSRRKLYKIKSATQDTINEMIEEQRSNFQESRIEYHDPSMAKYQD